MRHLIILAFVFSAQISLAQVTLTEESAITQMMDQYRQTNIDNPIVRAWKIQILTTNDRRTMETGIKKFEMLYPSIPYAWEHNPPYYQVRIGAYERKEDLEATLLELKKDFPSALPVQAEMAKTSLIE